MAYNDKLRLFFKSKGLSQKEVGKRLGHAPAMISRFWSGESSFGPDFIVSLVKEFPDVDLKYIFSEDENSNMVNEPNGNYGLRVENVDKELEIITDKLTEIRKVLAQNCHKN
jgi:transcriptional regulator with XRE-family HTH domain